MSDSSIPVGRRPFRSWAPQPFIANVWTRWALYAGALLYMVLAIGSVEVNWARLVLGLDRGWAFVQGFLFPDFSSRWGDIKLGFQESLTMTVTSTALGVLLSIPVAVGASRNLAPVWIYLLCRGFIALSRTLNEIIVAIFLVAMFSTYSDLLQIRQPAPLRCAAHILTKWFSCIHCRLLVNTWFISLVVVPKENLSYPRGYMSKAGYFHRAEGNPSHDYPGQHSHRHWAWANSADRLPSDP